MTADKFRRLALEISGAFESSHMGHPDFRLNGRVFASLGYPNIAHGMVKLTPDQQQEFLKQAPTVFCASAGAWGKQGSTTVNLVLARVPVVRSALRAASKQASAKKSLITPRRQPLRTAATRIKPSKSSKHE